VKEPQPRRVAPEVTTMKRTTVMGNNYSPPRKTRFKCASVATLTLLAASQASAKNWTPRKHLSTQASGMLCNELVSAVLDRNKLLKYRQLIQNPGLGEE
jgi:hypothetical protein